MKMKTGIGTCPSISSVQNMPSYIIVSKHLSLYVLSIKSGLSNSEDSNQMLQDETSDQSLQCLSLIQQFLSHLRDIGVP